jgi:glycosyltransferase involved in cell wall biosynthesis
MDLSVIVCTYNRSKALAEFLTSLHACAVPADIEWEILIVDNNSKDDTRAVVESFAKKFDGRLQYIFEERQGQSIAANTGIERARGEILAFTDDDLTLHVDWVAQIYKASQEFDCAGIGGRIVPVWTCKQPAWIDLDGPFRHEGFGGIVRFEQGDVPKQLTITATGANMAFKKTVFEKYGGFRTDLMRLKDLLGGQDTELCRRLMNAGERMFYAPQAIVYHPVEESRTTRKYCRDFAFHYGRWTVRTGGMPEGVSLLFGVPRYLFPVASKFFLKWMLSSGVKRRFFYRLELSKTFGQMVEGKRWLQNRSVQQPVQGLNPAK